MVVVYVHVHYNCGNRMLYSNGTLAGRKEVVLGMSDPMESNRVYMTLDHRLVIRNLTSSDTGRYSCSGLETDERLEYALDLLPANSGGRPGADVVAVTADSMAGWTQYESRYLAPVTKAFPIVWKMDVDWDPWGPCDGCAGKRYRRAACRVCFDVGIRMACRSIALPATVMTVSPGLAAKLSTLPDFLLAETCYAYCQVSNKRRLPKYRNTFVLEEGSSLTLVCAEATADKKVTWRKDGLLLTETESTADDTSGALLDTFGTLYLVRLTDNDSGNYTCFVDGNRTQEVLLVVRKSSLLSSKAYARHLYYLYYIFAMYFVVFGARIYYAFLNRRYFLKITDSDVLKPEIPIVYLGRKIRIR
ncbi:unnamed protein product [Aphis gossypii]|uniref:Ig-like domain-containing protein n=1 Tax=Aphis gossypii TaxID=80765 RepID=A0A9P0JEC6_APHGO|nr:unnamed protein product [Aphis gossypii]